MKLDVLEAPNWISTLESIAFAPSAVARTRALRDSPKRYASSFETFSTVLSMDVARARDEKFA